MKILKISSLNKLLQAMPDYSNFQYNGELIIKNSQGIQWTFYYRFGEMIWATGGTHPCRRFRRYVSPHFPHIDINKIHLPSQDVAIDYWDYIFLEYLSKQQPNRKAIDIIVENIISEIFFDVAQQIHLSK